MKFTGIYIYKHKTITMMTNVIKKFQTEQSSIDYFCKFLTKKGFKDINPTQYYDKYAHTDVYAVFEGKNYCFELKRRYMDSTQYGDCICEIQKVLFAREEKAKGNIDNAYLVSFYNDIFVINSLLKTECYKEWTKGAKTTEFGDDSIVDKCIFHYKQDRKIEYDEELFK